MARAWATGAWATNAWEGTVWADSSGNTIAVPAGSLTLTGYAPTVISTGGQVVSVPAGALTLTGFAPTVVNPNVVAVPAGALTLTGLVPTVLSPRTVAVPTGSLTLTGNAPTVTATQNNLISVPVGTLTITGYAPNITGAEVSVTPRRGVGFPRARRNYVYKGKRYLGLSNEELLRLISQDAIDITREDIKVSYKNQKPHIIAKDAWSDLQAALQSLKTLEEPEYDDDEDIESIIALL